MRRFRKKKTRTIAMPVRGRFKSVHQEDELEMLETREGLTRVYVQNNQRQLPPVARAPPIGGPTALEMAQTLVQGTCRSISSSRTRFRSTNAYDPMIPIKLPRSRNGTKSATMISVKDRIPPPPRKKYTQVRLDDLCQS